ncbi:MAG: hypothetical protein U5L45_03010 [Saprospiraceae bacterium]|nr:hypothetical protein [Saprospiraceae bacterium]
MFRFWASPKIETHLPCFTSEASYKNGSLLKNPSRRRRRRVLRHYHKT